MRLYGWISCWRQDFRVQPGSCWRKHRNDTAKGVCRSIGVGLGSIGVGFGFEVGAGPSTGVGFGFGKPLREELAGEGVACAFTTASSCFFLNSSAAFFSCCFCKKKTQPRPRKMTTKMVYLITKTDDFLGSRAPKHRLSATHPVFSWKSLDGLPVDPCRAANMANVGSWRIVVNRFLQRPRTGDAL